MAYLSAHLLNYVRIQRNFDEFHSDEKKHFFVLHYCYTIGIHGCD